MNQSLIKIKPIITKLLHTMGFDGIPNIRMIRFFLMQFMNIADGDLSTKLSSKNHCQNSMKEF